MNEMMNPVEVFRIVRLNRDLIPIRDQIKIGLTVAIFGTAYGLIVSFIMGDAFSILDMQMLLILLVGALIIGFVITYLLSLRLIKKYNLKLQRERTEIQDKEIMDTFLGRLTLFEIENRALTIALAFLALAFAVCLSIGYGLFTSNQATLSGMALNATIVLTLVGVGGLVMINAIILWVGFSSRGTARRN
jgi:hypothetical protein